MQTALVIILLLAILGGAVFVGHYGWVSAGDVTMRPRGWMMTGLGIFFTPSQLAAVLWPWCPRAAVPARWGRLRSCKKKKRRVAKLAKMIPRRKKRRRQLLPPRKSAPEISPDEKTRPREVRVPLERLTYCPVWSAGVGCSVGVSPPVVGLARGGWTILAVSCSGVTPWPVPV